MDKFFALLAALTVTLGLLTGCERRANEVNSLPESSGEPQDTVSEPAGFAENMPEESPEPPETSSQLQESSEADTIETAAFALGNAGEPHEIAQGDTIGDWTLANLKITYMDDGSLNMLRALFTGDITLKGTIAPSVFTEDGFDFRVAAEDEGKMPCYITPEMTPKDESWMMLNIPEDIASTLNLEGEVECEITVSDYRFVFAYMMAPASATVVDIELMQSFKSYGDAASNSDTQQDIITISQAFEKDGFTIERITNIQLSINPDGSSVIVTTPEDIQAVWDTFSKLKITSEGVNQVRMNDEKMIQIDIQFANPNHATHVVWYGPIVIHGREFYTFAEGYSEQALYDLISAFIEPKPLLPNASLTENG